MSVRREIGQLLIGSLPANTIPSEMRSIAREFQLGGITLFARNIEDAEQVFDLARETQQLAAALPLWVGVDQEGGRVARLKAPFTEWPAMAVLGRSGDPMLATRFAAALAAELRAVGVTLDYAPVLDIHTNSANPVIGDRALAADAQMVATLGAAIIRGLEDNGVAACGKHFPGHGDTTIDSHLDLPIVEHGPDRIRRVELMPFREAVRQQVAFLMTAHVLVPSFDADKPATLSPRIVRALLREELDYDGVILSDDLEMQAITRTYSVADAAVQAIAAGCDGVLICSGDFQVQAATLEALLRAVEDKVIPYRRVEDALLRQRRAKERFLAHPVATPSAFAPRAAAWRQVLGCDAHRRVAEEMARFQ